MTDTQKNDKNSRLGKGLAALISEEKIDNSSKNYIPNLPTDWISPNPHQPRMPIRPEDIVELSESIQEYGVLEPLLVIKETDKNYILIAGERRLRASQLANMDTVPAVVMDHASPLQMLQIAIIENVQRKDLNPLEEAEAYVKLSDEHKLSHAQIAKTLGQKRVTITNKIRLLKLPSEVKEYLIAEDLSEGHGRALLGLENDQSIITAARTVLKKKLSVRATEELVRKIMKGSTTKDKKKNKGGRPGKDYYKTKADYTLEKSLTNRLKTDVKIERYANSGGKIILKYKTQEQLDKIAKILAD